MSIQKYVVKFAHQHSHQDHLQQLNKILTSLPHLQRHELNLHQDHSHQDLNQPHVVQDRCVHQALNAAMV